MLKNLQLLDLIPILSYIVMLLSIGLHYSGKEEKSIDYFLAEKKVGWVAIGASLFVTSISYESFVGLLGFKTNLCLFGGNFELLVAFVVLLLTWVFAPFYLRSNVFTIPEFLQHRYNKSSRLYLSAVSIISNIFIKLLLVLYAGGFLLKEIMGLDLAVSALIMIAIAGVYAVTGGLKAIVRVDIFQTIVLITGVLIVAFYITHQGGGISQVGAKAPVYLSHLFRPAAAAVLPWTGIVFGLPILGIWYWCTDQYSVQRVLAGKNLNHVQSGTLLAAFLKIVPAFALFLVGILAYAQFSDSSIGQRGWAGLEIARFLPPGIKGILVASLLAAFISSLASSFNSSSSLFTFDFYRFFRPDSTEPELVLVGRLATVAIIFMGIFIAPFLRYIELSFFFYLLKFQAYIAPSIIAVFVWGLAWKRANGTGAIWTLLLGGGTGLVFLLFDLLCDHGHVNAPILLSIARINFLHFTVFLFVLSSGILILVSLMTERKLQKPVAETPFFFKTVGQKVLGQKSHQNELTWAKWNIGFSALLVITCVALFLSSR
ncbi:sodium/solute symporter [candidate division KSB1 bacterium]|nr:sodium/solute symporter [candidate division KSB1 bacterium]